MADSDPVTKKDVMELKESLTELIRDVETNLLTSFHCYGRVERVQNLETRSPY